MSQQAGDPGELLVWSQAESQLAQDPGRADVSVQDRRQEEASVLVETS